MSLYYQDEAVTLYHGDWRELIPEDFTADLIVTDPPYGETSLEWDRWPTGWPSLAARHSRSMWCFGSMRMFLDQRDEFADWRLAQDVVWSKPRARSTTTDRFARSHEYVLHWYQERWGDLYRDPPRIAYHGVRVRAVRPSVSRPNDGTKVKPVSGGAVYEDDGTRLMTTVLTGDPGDPRTTLHPTQKPLSILSALIRYSCPPNGRVLDPFAGSGSTLVAAKQLGRKAIGVELEERYCEVIAKRLAQGVLDFGSAS